MAEALAQLSMAVIILQFLINIVVAEGFSKMNSYMFLLQYIVYSMVFLDFWIHKILQDTFVAMLRVATLDFIPEWAIEGIFKVWFGLKFNEDN